MKQNLKNETLLLDIVNKIQSKLAGLESKLDALIKRSEPTTIKPAVTALRPHDIHNKERVSHKAICADCQKECNLPFKPSGDRPVYCQDCFSRRKVISMSKMGLPHPPVEAQSTPSLNKSKQKSTVIKKSAAKKKSTPKKK